MIIILQKKFMKNNKIYFHNKNPSVLKTKICNQRQVTPLKLQVRPTSSLSHMKQHKRNQSTTISMQKENKKIETNLTYNTPKIKTKEPLKLKTYSNHVNLKLNNNPIEKLQYKQGQIKKEEGQVFQQLFLQMINLLKKNFIITQTHITSFTIKKDHLLSLFTFLLVHQQLKIPTNTTEYDYLSNIVEQFNKIIQETKCEQKKLKLKLNSKVSDQSLLNYNYAQQLKTKKNQLQLLIDKIQALTESIKNLQKAKPQLQQQYSTRQQKLIETNRIIQKNIASISHLQNQQSSLKQELTKSTLQIQKIKKEFTNIQNFINTQNNQLIIMASEDYKNIETDIYDYASYLQCNQLASSLSYQPLSITCITENLEEQIKNINKNLIQNQKMGPKEKGRAMRDFLLQWMNKFKKKDEQTKQMMAFKTKCVKNFIQKMQKWMQNWTFKQQYLVGLKKQFVVDTMRMTQSIKQLVYPHFCELCSATLIPLSNKIKEIYEKIENNYKLGNSFY